MPPRDYSRDSLGGPEESRLLFIFRGCPPHLQCWGSWDTGGARHRWARGCHRDFNLEQKRRRHQGQESQPMVPAPNPVSCAQAPLLTDLPLPGLCREAAGCPPGLATRQPGPQSPPALTLGFFTPLPLGCSSESCRFRGLFSAGGVSTKLESWGSGVAFSPKGSDWWRETSRIATRASGLGVPVIRNPDALLTPAPTAQRLGCRKNAGLQSHWLLATM